MKIQNRTFFFFILSLMFSMPLSSLNSVFAEGGHVAGGGDSIELRTREGVSLAKTSLLYVDSLHAEEIMALGHVAILNQQSAQAIVDFFNENRGSFLRRINKIDSDKSNLVFTHEILTVQEKTGERTVIMKTSLTDQDSQILISRPNASSVKSGNEAAYLILHELGHKVRLSGQFIEDDEVYFGISGKDFLNSLAYVILQKADAMSLNNLSIPKTTYSLKIPNQMNERIRQLLRWYRADIRHDHNLGSQHNMIFDVASTVEEKFMLDLHRISDRPQISVLPNDVESLSLVGIYEGEEIESGNACRLEILSLQENQGEEYSAKSYTARVSFSEKIFTLYHPKERVWIFNDESLSQCTEQWEYLMTNLTSYGNDIEGSRHGEHLWISLYADDPNYQLPFYFSYRNSGGFLKRTFGSPMVKQCANLRKVQ